MCIHLENSDEQHLHRAVTGYTAMNLQQVAAKAKKKKKIRFFTIKAVSKE